VFYLPPYSPHLSIAEILWKNLKGGWLYPDDYKDNQNLAYAVSRCLANVGNNLTIKFNPFNQN
jgi:transposase